MQRVTFMIKKYFVDLMTKPQRKRILEEKALAILKSCVILTFEINISYKFQSNAEKSV